jgi:hypothetical protein
MQKYAWIDTLTDKWLVCMFINYLTTPYQVQRLFSIKCNDMVMCSELQGLGMKQPISKY